MSLFPGFIIDAVVGFVRPLVNGWGFRLYGSTSGSVGFKPQAVAGSIDYVLPSVDGSGGYVLTTDGSHNLSWAAASSGSGTVTTLSIVTANGVSGIVANPTTTPAITLTLGAITPTSIVASGNISGANLSGSNTGDQDLSGLVPKTTTVNGHALSSNVTLTTADIADSSNKRYVTDAELVVIGNTSGTNTGDQTNISGNAGTATILQTARNINGVAFDGSASITVTAAAGTLTGTTLASNVVTSSLTTVGTIGTGTWQGTKVGLAYGGTNSDLSATGGTSQVLKQTSSGGAVTVGQLAVTDLSTSTTGSGNIVLASGATLTNPIVGTQATSDNSTLAASTAYVTTAINTLLANSTTKTACKYSTTAALPTNIYNNGSSGVGATLTGVVNGILTIDGSTPSVGDRILVDHEATAANNGIFTVTIVGTSGTVYVLTRSTDFNSTAEIAAGDTVFVTSGSTLAGTTWTMITGGSITVGTTAISFTQVAGPGTYVNGTGLGLSGSTFSVLASQTQVTAVGTLVTGTWNASVIGPTYGGTGVNNGSNTLTIGASASVSGSNTGDQTITLTGNVTGSGTGSFATTIAAGAVTNAMLSGSIAASKLVGTDIATIGTITSGTWHGTLIGATYGGTGVNNGSNTLTIGASASVSGSNTGDQTITLTNDVTGTGTGSFATTIAANAVTYAKFQQVAANSVVGNSTGSLANATAISLTAAATASTVAYRDSNGNSAFNNAISACTSVTSAAGTTTLTVASTRVQLLTGTNTQTFKLPDATTLSLYQTFEFNNNSTGALTVVDNASGAVCTVPAGGYGLVIVTNIGSAAGVWDNHPMLPANCTYGTAGLVITGTMSCTALTSTGITVLGNNAFEVVSSDGSIRMWSSAVFGWTAGNLAATFDTMLTRKAAATFQLGNVDAAAPVAQNISCQSVVTATSNAAGANFTFKCSQGTGTGIGGSFIVQVAPAGTTGSSVNALATALTIDSTKLATFAGNITANNLSLANTFTTSGNFALTLTTTASTNVTLPTSGTLVNSAVATLSSLTSIGTIGTGVWQGTVVGATYGGTGVNNGASTITIGGSVTFSGAFTTTLTVTANTSVTLPSWGGTLLSTTVQALTPGTTVSWNMASGWNVTLAPTQAQNYTLSNPTNLVAGASGFITITQPASGTPPVITWSSHYLFAGGTKFVTSTAANAVDTLSWYSPDGTNIHVTGLAAFA